MQDTLTATDHPGLVALVDLVATAEASDDLLVSSNRLVDALLDARGEVEPGAVAFVDGALAACAHRHVVPTSEAVEMVATIAAAAAQPDECVVA